ncbi:MAG TPA: efflux RND transporter permease subunit, partial [Solirubrobacterales bacterium]|nr:efflux RND transporter permease subunit [Solirubrobacterales bacterium]
MIERILRASFGKPVLTLLLALAAAAAGAVWLGELKRDVFPDLATPVFSVFVQNPAMGTEELETGVAIPLEVALAGLPDVRRIRSGSQAGVAQVRVEFEPDADYHLSRQLVTERVNQVARELPPGTGAPLVSSLTGRLNEVLEIVLEAEPGTAGLMELRDLAEYELRNRLLGVPGVAAVEVLGGHLRQFQVQLDPARMAALGVTLDEVMTAVRRSNENAAGGFVAQGSVEWTVRAVGRAENVGDLRATVVAMRDTTPVLLGEVAEVREAPAVRRGMAHGLGSELVNCRVSKQFGADTVTVARGVRAAVADLAESMPPGVTVRVLYDQADLVSSALGGVGRAVLLGAVLVAAVLFLLLGNLRAALIVTLTLPLSVALAGLILKPAGIGLNTMTLGGLAIAVGLLVDAAIILTENVFHRLNVAQGASEGAGTISGSAGPSPPQSPSPTHPPSTRERGKNDKEELEALGGGSPLPRGGRVRGRGAGGEGRRQIVLAAALEVGRPIAFATLIVIAVFTPLFAMSGIEGRMYRPLAAAVVAAMAASLVLALTLVPVLAAWMLRPGRAGAEEDVLLIRRIKAFYGPLLDRCMRRAGLVRVLSLAVTLPALLLAFRIGSDFMPQLDEGALLLQTVLPPEASLEEVDRRNHRVEDVLRELPEVQEVVRRTGRAERTEDPMPHVISDVLVVLKPERSRPIEELEEEMRERLAKVPGVAVLFTTPLGMRIDEGLGGTPADLQVRIYGPDLDRLARLAEEARELMEPIEGITDLRAETLTGLPQIRITVDREAVARVGLAPADVIDALRIGLAGEEVSQIWVGQRRFDLIVRLADDRRGDLSALGSLLIDGKNGSRVPLGQLARVEQTFGPGSIQREAGSRRIAVEASVTGRDLGSTAAEVRQRLTRGLKLPTGYFFDLGGRVENQARAMRSLTLAIAVALLAVL